MTVPGLGDVCLLLTLLTSGYACVGGLMAYWRRYKPLLESVRGAVIAVALCLSMAAFALEYLFITKDFAVRAVYNHIDRTLPVVYRLTALWGGDSGSVLFWEWILSLYLAYVAWRGFERHARVNALVLPLTAAEMTFFSIVLLWGANPYASVTGDPANGAGLDPLLRNPVMIIHPPAMYTGLIGLSIAAAVMASALWQRIPWGDWLELFRYWLLFSWTILGTALILGGMWAYLVLGWGGYWEWDPVENAALLPWLAATGCLHGVQLVERQRTSKMWTVCLGASAFLLTLVGTYITRSGMLKNSVHSFTGSGIGPYFVALFIGAGCGIGVLMALRWDWIRGEPATSRPGPQESGYRALLQSLSAIMLIVLVGTFFPVISKVMAGHTVILTQGFFNAATTPLFLLIVVLVGVAPVLPWTPVSARSWVGRIWRSAVLGVGIGIFCYVRGYHQWWSLTGMVMVSFSLASVGQALYRHTRRKPHSVLRVKGERRRVGGYLTHAAFLIIALGIVGSHSNAVSVTKVVRPGQVVAIDGYRLRYESLIATAGLGVIKTTAHVQVVQGHRAWRQAPAMSFFDGANQPIADVSIHQGVMQNLYLVLQAFTRGHGAVLDVMITPMVSWIWLGLPVLLAGSIMAIYSPRERGSGDRSGGLIPPTPVTVSPTPIGGAYDPHD